MDDEIAVIHIPAGAAHTLSWLAIVHEELEQLAAGPHVRHGDPGADVQWAVNGIGALALRTDDATPIANLGLDVLVQSHGHEVNSALQQLDELWTEDGVVLWDSPDDTIAGRYGLDRPITELSSEAQLLVIASNEIRRAALRHTTVVHLVSSNECVTNTHTPAAYSARVLDPGWAALQAIAQFAEVEALVASGVLEGTPHYRWFRWAAATAVRAFRAYPEASTEVFAQFSIEGRVANPTRLEPWSILVRPMVDQFLNQASKNRSLLVDLPDGTNNSFVRTREAIRDLAVAIGSNPSGRPDPHLGRGFGD